jgi:hypothetical protein
MWESVMETGREQGDPILSYVCKLNYPRTGCTLEQEMVNYELAKHSKYTLLICSLFREES